jgi:hypothetical protein
MMRGRAILGMLVFAGLSACSLLSSLDYLQAGRGAPLGPDAIASDGGDDPNAPGCPPERWSTCGVTVLVDAGTPIAIVSDPGGRTFFADQESGDIAEVSCRATTCTPLRTWVVGQRGITKLAHAGLDAVWFSGDELRTAETFARPDAGLPPVRTIATAKNPSALHSGSFVTAWADDDGIHHFHVNRSVVDPYDVLALVTPQRASVVFVKWPTLYFVSGGEVFTCPYDQNSYRCASEPVVIVGARGAESLGEASGFASGDAGGTIATRSAEGGTEIVLLDQGDAGVLPVVASETDEIRSLSAYDRDIYFTTKSGALRRRTLGVASVVTVLRGLGPRAMIGAALDQVFVADPDRHIVLRVVQ